MQKRYMAIWFRHLLTDGLMRRRPELKGTALVLSMPVKNKMIITAASADAEKEGAFTGMAVADARAAVPNLLVMDNTAGQELKLLSLIGLGCIKYTPVVAVHAPDSLLLDISGCAHLWGGERNYLKEIVIKLREGGFDARAAIADTMATAWAVAHYAKKHPIIPSNFQAQAIAPLPPAALRLPADTLDRLQKLGFKTIAPLLQLPASVLRRRFGQQLLQRIDEALGRGDEYFEPLIPPVPYIERLPCFDPVRTAEGIGMAIEKLLINLCLRLQSEGIGIRKAIIKCHRIDGKRVQAGVSTTRATHSVSHLLKLFQLQINKIEPALGIELFVLEATRTDDMDVTQEQLWAEAKGLADTALAELLDRIAGKVGAHTIKRYLPAQHHWPERAVTEAASLADMPESGWPQNARPLRLLQPPETIEVMALVPDHPPKMFIYKNKRHIIARADGPERIGREWWHDEGEHRDYYMLEDTSGNRYWVYRSGFYDSEDACWYLHGFFA